MTPVVRRAREGQFDRRPAQAGRMTSVVRLGIAAPEAASASCASFEYTLGHACLFRMQMSS
jgi:hypothetical protein